MLMIIEIMIPCMAVFSASSFFPSPKNLDILELMPITRPEFNPIRIKNTGKENVNAAIDSAPNLPTNAVSTTLYTKSD